MEFLRVYWPSLLGSLLVLLHLATLFRRTGSDGPGAAGRADRLFSLVVTLLLFVLLLGAQAANRGAFRSLAERERRSAGAEQALQRANQEWSLRLVSAESARDSLRFALDSLHPVPFEGIVLAGDEPVRGARVSLFRREKRRDERERTLARDIATDREGRFRTEIPALPGGAAIRIEVDADGFSPVKRWLSPPLPGRPVTIRLSP